MMGELRGYADAASFGHWVKRQNQKTKGEPGGLHTYLHNHSVSKFSKQTLPFAANWGGISRQGAKDALKNFLMTAQKLDAQNATSRLSQVERFRSQVWAFTPRKKPDKKTQAKQIIWHCTKNRT